MNEITAKEVKGKLNAKEDLHIIDVREADELLGGKIKGAINIPLQSLMDRIDELNKKDEYILVCRSGARSDMARQILETQGFSATNMIDGMNGWDGPVDH